uniref:Uncharacterized protein n=1 Tax=Knipowitschia caucasica TaxID=637954 RepID=A0AAV2LEV6_KNICA
MSTNETLRNTVSDSDAATASLHDNFGKVFNLLQQQKEQPSQSEALLVQHQSTIENLEIFETQVEEKRCIMTELEAIVERRKQRLEFHDQPTVALSPNDNTPRGDSKCVLQNEGKGPKI